MSSYEKGSLPAIVLGLGPAALELARSLGRRGVRVHGLDHRLGIAAASRYCLASRSASPRREPEQALEDILRLSRRCDSPPVLMPLTDDWVALVAGRRETLAPWCRFVLSPLAADLTDKAALYALAERHGVPVPRWALVGEWEELPAAAEGVGFPCALKPALSLDWAQPEARAVLGQTKLLTATDDTSLRQSFARARSAADRHILQELVPGDDTQHCYVLCCLGPDGEARREFVHRKLLMRPPGRGVGCLIESVWEPEPADLARAFLRDLGYVGLAGMEFKRDARDGQWKLLDLNPRWGIGDSLAGICGIDVAWLHYCDCTGRKAEAPADYRRGVRWVQLRPYLSASWAARRQGVRFLRRVADLRGEVHHGTFAWDDLRPALASLRETVVRRGGARPPAPPAPTPRVEVGAGERRP